MKWYLEVLKKYVMCEGRARRKEYWTFILFTVFFTILASIMSYELRGFNIIFIIYLLGMIISIISVTVRRLHDIGKSGFWILLRLIPVIGSIWLLILLCTKGETGLNEYGEDPKFMIM